MHRTLKRFVRAARVLSNMEAPGRKLRTFPDDVFLVSYPKSGNTWLRFLVGNLVNPHPPVTFANIESRVSSIYLNPESRLRRLQRPRILKSHECFVPQYKRVIYLVRDPRDVCISYYHYLIKYRELPEKYSMEDFVARFVQDDFEGQFGPWGDHVMSWLSAQRSRAAFLLLRYRDLLRDPSRALAQVAQFLGMDASPQELAEAIDLSSAKRMRDLEKLQSRQWISTKKSRQDLPFVRAAVSDQWKSALSLPLVRAIEAAWGPAMQVLGYELSSAEKTVEISADPASLEPQYTGPFYGEGSYSKEN